MVQASSKCDTFPLCNADDLEMDVSNSEFEYTKNCTDCEETSIESPLMVSTTEIPIKPPEPSAFRDVHLFDLDTQDGHETTSDEQPDVSQSTFDSTETTKSLDFFKVNDELILRDLADIEGKQRIEVEPRRTTPPSIMSTLVFPPLPRGDLYRVHTLDLEEGLFPFSFISTLVSILQSAAYPLDLARDALLQKITVLELVSQSISQESGTIAVLTLGAMLGVGTPLTLLILCCVSLVRKCRDKDKLEEQDCGSDTDSAGGGNCKRRGLVFALLLVLSLLAAGIAGILAANQQVGTGMVRAPVALDTALGDAATFVRNSHQQLRFVSATTARQLARSTQERLAELRAQVDTFRRQCPGRDRPLCETLDTAGLEVAVSLDHVSTLKEASESIYHIR
ncbi:hypothetical protein B566_EDAN011477 [Ephemera danica]|nr:hypothetical protein B566_EDAN011477 [Ephemera danica]